jgi:DNA-binding NarL/FixJ family response regulator
MRNAPLQTAPAVFFTPRERQFLELAADGRGNKEIAFTLGLAVSSVKDLASRVYRKAGVIDCRQLVAWCNRHQEDIRLGVTREPGLRQPAERRAA